MDEITITKAELKPRNNFYLVDPDDITNAKCDILEQRYDAAIKRLTMIHYNASKITVKPPVFARPQ